MSSKFNKHTLVIALFIQMDGAEASPKLPQTNSTRSPRIHVSKVSPDIIPPFGQLYDMKSFEDFNKRYDGYTRMVYINFGALIR